VRRDLFPALKGLTADTDMQQCLIPDVMSADEISCELSVFLGQTFISSFYIQGTSAAI
jgi:hypothetical protein